MIFITAITIYCLRSPKFSVSAFDRNLTLEHHDHIIDYARETRTIVTFRDQRCYCRIVLFSKMKGKLLAYSKQNYQQNSNIVSHYCMSFIGRCAGATLT